MEDGFVGSLEGCNQRVWRPLEGDIVVDGKNGGFLACLINVLLRALECKCKEQGRLSTTASKTAELFKEYIKLHLELQAGVAAACG
jgi:hypothetical protein